MYSLSLIIAVVILMAITPFLHTLWSVYVRRIPLGIIQKGIISETEPYRKKIAQGAYKYYEQSLSKQEEKFFPCPEKGWICAPHFLACTRGEPRYKASQRYWKHSCWQHLNFDIKGSYFAQYCYRATGKGKNATFQIKVMGQTNCNKKVLKMLFTYDHRRSPSYTIEVK